MKKYINTLSRLSVILLVTGFFSLTFISCSSSSSANTEPSEPLFSSGNIADGESFSFTFQEEGTFPFFCKIHSPDPGMQGTITVSSDAEISGEFTISMENLQFNPSNITVAPGTKVTWVNNDGVIHFVKSGNPDSGSSDPNGPRY